MNFGHESLVHNLVDELYMVSLSIIQSRLVLFLYNIYIYNI